MCYTIAGDKFLADKQNGFGLIVAKLFVASCATQSFFLHHISVPQVADDDDGVGNVCKKLVQISRQ